MFVVGKCKKCGSYGLFNTADKSREEVEKFMKERDFGECAFGGWHVEIGKMGDYIDIFWGMMYETKAEADKKLEELRHV